ncbi:MAG TPA: protein-glutamate O-methyltransferase CheR [Actinomycetota bacterium]|nr:protein-glutamate O-methyltransferase CheR [Actinomycetota bacterium]
MTPGLHPELIDRFRDFMRARMGLAVPSASHSDLRRVIGRVAQETGHADGSSLLSALSGAASADTTTDALLSALNIGETHFFRDSQQIDMLRASILPDVIIRRSRERKIRVWSAGCSTGEEPYTLAILLHQLIPDIASWDVRILATDLNANSLSRAERGRYREWSFRGMPPALLGNWITKHDDYFEVSPDIRKMVSFSQLNLAEDRYPPATDPMDLILCRNVLLYFDHDQARAVVGRLSRCLADHGRLLVSRVDAGLPVFASLRSDRAGSGVFAKREADEIPRATPTAPAPPHPPAPLPRTRRRLRPHRSGKRTTGTVAVAPRTEQRDPRAGAAEEFKGAPGKAADESPFVAWREAGRIDAMRLTESQLQGDPLSAPLNYLRGLLLLECGDLTSALAAFRRATYIDPRFVLGHLGKATVLARSGQKDAAATALEVAARLAAEHEPREYLVPEDRLTAADVLEMIAAERMLLGEGIGGYR